MSRERYETLVYDVCNVVGLPDADHVLETRTLEVEGFEVRLEHYDTDETSLYVNFHYGVVTAGRTLTIFRLMLEANLLIYAQDQAQLCLDADTGSIVLLVHLTISDALTGDYLADVLTHYAEHGRYWQTNIIESPDEMFEGIVAGNYLWLRA